MIKIDKRVRAVFDVVGGGLLGMLGADIVRVLTSSDSTASLWVNKITESLFDVSISLAQVDGGNTALGVIGGVLIGGIGLLQFYDAFKKLSR